MRGWAAAQISVLRLLGSGTLAVLALAAVVGDGADQDARAKGLMWFSVELPQGFLGHHCIQDAEEPPPEPEPPPCPRAAKKAR
jgi:hypothetical protein